MYQKPFHFDDIDHQIISMIQQGKTAKEIGILVFKSSRTIEQRIYKLREFYKAKNIKHLITIVNKICADPATIEVESAAETKAMYLLKRFGKAEWADEAAKQMIKENTASINFWAEVRSFINQNKTGAKQE